MITAVLLQNATVRRTVQMMEALLEKYGTKVAFDNKEIYALWQPEDLEKVSEDELRALKIGYRAKFIKRLSEDFARGVIDEKKLRTMDKESAKEELTKLYGVGPETARILLFEALHHYDTFEHIAPWQQKIIRAFFTTNLSCQLKKSAMMLSKPTASIPCSRSTIFGKIFFGKDLTRKLGGWKRKLDSKYF